MKALITGASSGLGKEFAYQLANQGYDLILVARRKNDLLSIKNEVKTKCKVIPLDISDHDNLDELLFEIENEDIDLVINNAGFGLLGEFDKINLEDEIKMINLNIMAVHQITKKFVNIFKEKNQGTILNVSSTAAFSAGPLFSTYYATKGYVLKLTEAIYEELRQDNSNVGVSILCPGPVDTNFNEIAHGKFKNAMSKEDVVAYALKKLKSHKLYIIPGFKNKVCVVFLKLLPSKLVLKLNYRIQKKKIEQYKENNSK